MQRSGTPAIGPRFVFYRKSNTQESSSLLRDWFRDFASLFQKQNDRR